MRRRIGGAVAAVALALVLAGCGVPGISEPRAVAVPVEAMVCTDSMVGSGTAVAGTIPDGVEVVAVLQCLENVSVEDEDGIGMASILERYEGDLAPFLAAIGAPNEPRWLGACTADMVIVPDLWAETADGRFLNLSYPLSGCGQPRGPAAEAASAALEAMTPVEETVTRIGTTESFAATSVGCATQATVVLLALEDGLDAAGEGAGATRDPVRGVPIDLPELADADDVDTLRVCVYESAAATSATVYASSHELRTPDARAAVEALAGAAPTTDTCATRASLIVVAHPILKGNVSAAPFTVELDGCRRAVDPSLQARASPPELLALLAPPG